MSEQKVSTREYRPMHGVVLKDGCLKGLFENNQQYLLRHFTVNDLLNPFYVRAGKNAPERSRPEEVFWESELEGSNAGRFLMGAGYTLCFAENPQLRQQMDRVVSGIAECAEEDGYCMAYPKSHMMIMERANYTRTYLNRGLVAALAAGNQEAGRILRAQQDWFFRYPHKHKIMELHLPWQGMLADTDAAMSAVGKDTDVRCAEMTYVKHGWLDRILRGDTKAIWKYPNDSTHSNELIAFFSYAQLYLLTGELKYYQAVLAVWDMIRKYWIHEGGTIALCEEHNNIHSYHPNSRPVTMDRHTGEVCASVMWIMLNDILLQLDPENEAYAAEIEHSVYNAMLPAQSGSDGIRYHTYLHGKKDRPTHENTCCEGTAAQFYGMLPAFIFRRHSADDGATVHLFAGAKLDYTTENGSICLDMDTKFPEEDTVTLTVRTEKPVRFPLRIRVPGWMSEDLKILCCGKILAAGKPGSYITLDRMWEGETTLSFRLKRQLKALRYQGVSAVRGYERYALMDGPVLMAVTGPSVELDKESVGWAVATNPHDGRSAWNVKHWILDANPEDPRSFLSCPGFTVKPYYQVGNTEEFTCYPLVKQTSADYPISPEQSCETGLRRRVVCGETAIELMGIPAGSFDMGQEGFEPCELPVHEETMDKPFFMGIYPVTQQQYQAVMGENPSFRKNPDCPVEMVTWEEAMAFVNKLNKVQSEVWFYLPTEKEWEYACRAGSKDICGYATDLLTDFAPYVWSIANACGVFKPRPVGGKLQNAWGLYDMLGNTGEWCADIYRSYDPEGFCAPGLRVVRGGTIGDLNTTCRCATRNAMEPDWKNKFTGFRVAAFPR